MIFQYGLEPVLSCGYYLVSKPYWKNIIYLFVVCRKVMRYAFSLSRNKMIINVYWIGKVMILSWLFALTLQIIFSLNTDTLYLLKRIDWIKLLFICIDKNQIERLDTILFYLKTKHFKTRMAWHHPWKQSSIYLDCRTNEHNHL